MKKIKLLFVLLLLLLTSCKQNNYDGPYVVERVVDGDTFIIRMNDERVRVRALCIDTPESVAPESTGKIEEFGKTASKFTKEKLAGAESIYIESEDLNWNADSTGGRYLVWVWYRNSASEEYRNLNIEILQNGLAIASSSANNKYGQACIDAINQAKALKLNIYSGEKDPIFFYGSAVELTLKEILANLEEYNGIKVAFECNIYQNYNNSVYVEEYDPETDMYYGMAVYYGFSASGDLLELLSVGNRVRICGSLQYYEAGGTYQVSGLQYNGRRPNDPESCNLLSSDGSYTAAYKETSIDTFSTNPSVPLEFIVEDDEGVESLITKNVPYLTLAMNTSISMNNLYVKSVYTTESENEESNGALTLTCTLNGKTVKVRTIVLKDASGKKVTEDYFKGKTINVKGMIDFFSDEYQIKVFRLSDISFVE